MNPQRAWIGLGSNLDDPRGHVEDALAELDCLPLTRCVAASRLYASRPLGPQDQPDFIKDRKSTRLNSSHVRISYAVFCLKKKKKKKHDHHTNNNTVQLLYVPTQLNIFPVTLFPIPPTATHILPSITS